MQPKRDHLKSPTSLPSNKAGRWVDKKRLWCQAAPNSARPLMKSPNILSDETAELGLGDSGLGGKPHRERQTDLLINTGVPPGGEGWTTSLGFQKMVLSRDAGPNGERRTARSGSSWVQRVNCTMITIGSQQQPSFILTQSISQFTKQFGEAQFHFNSCEKKILELFSLTTSLK